MTEISQPLRIPQTDEHTVIFNYQNFHGRFDLSNYTPQMTDNRLSVAELQQFFQKLEEYLQSWRKSVKRFSMFICFFCLMSIGGSLSVPLVFVLTGNIQIVLYIMIPLIVGLSFRILWMSFKPAREIQLRLQEAKLKAELFINSNERFFRARGLRWNIPPHFPEWIELCKEYRRQDPNHIAFGVPVVEIV